MMKQLLGLANNVLEFRSPKMRADILIWIVGFLFLIIHSTAFAQSKPPLPHFTTGPVVDETGSLNAQQIAALDQKLNTYHDSTGTWIAIALIHSANGYPLEDLAIEIADSNGLKAKNNNVAIILLSMNEHKGFIATGYGLEPTLTDAATSMVYQEILVPALRRGDAYGGLDSATTAMIQIVAGEFHNEQARSPLRRRPNPPSVTGVFLIVIGFFILMFLLRAMAGTGASRTVVGAGGGSSGCMGGILQGLFWSTIFNTGRSGWGSGGLGGGGFGGGSSGGWGGFGGGGGGGSFGGGGAGGGW
jgi:uncharacterized protein